MPVVSHRGQNIHYETMGEGPIVLMQHGLFSRGNNWLVNGYVKALADEYCVVRVDSLGHGKSDKPHDRALYSREQRAGDLVAVLDALGAERMHLVGYSMGGWMATGVAKHHPDRLASIAIGGWDPIGGISFPGTMRPNIRQVLAAARLRLPELVAWVTPEIEPALAACFDALTELEGTREALRALACPVLLWSGDGDGCHDAMKKLAEEERFRFLPTRGDHASAMVLDVPLVIGELKRMFSGGGAKT